MTVLCAERDTKNQRVHYKAEVLQLHQPAASITTKLFICHNKRIQHIYHTWIRTKILNLTHLRQHDEPICNIDCIIIIIIIR